MLEGHTLPDGSAVIDVGAGTSALSKMVAEYGGVSRIVCLDYDEEIVADGRAQETDPRVEWRVGDARDPDAYGENVGAVTFFDILHEVYSFVGRSPADGSVHHATGLDAVKDVPARRGRRAGAGRRDPDHRRRAPGGGRDGHGGARARRRSSALLHRIEREYPSRPLEIAWLDDERFEIPVAHADHAAHALQQAQARRRGALGGRADGGPRVHEGLGVRVVLRRARARRHGCTSGRRRRRTPNGPRTSRCWEDSTTFL